MNESERTVPEVKMANESRGWQGKSRLNDVEIRMARLNGVEIGTTMIAEQIKGSSC